MDGQTIVPRNYAQQFKPEMSVLTGSKLSAKTLNAFNIKPWPPSLAVPRTNEIGIVVNYYPFIKDPVEDKGYYVSVKHSDGTIAVYYKDDLYSS